MDLEGSAYRDRQQSEHTRLRRNRMFSRHRMHTKITGQETCGTVDTKCSVDTEYSVDTED